MKSLYLLLIPLILFSCSNTSPEMDMMYADNVMREVADDIETDLAPVQQTNNAELTKKLIKTGTIHFQSESIAQDYEKIKRILSKYDSYIGSENETNTGYQIRYDISIRVASKNYDSLFNKLSLLSNNVEFKSSNIEDVTERYYDLKTRIRNKKLLEDKYIALLKRAATIKDVLEIERSINEIRNEIESAEGSFKYLSKQISYSTIQLNFYETLPDYYKPDGFWSRVSNAIGGGWQEFLSFLVVLAQGWPFIILVVLGIYIFRKRRSFKLNKK